MAYYFDDFNLPVQKTWPDDPGAVGDSAAESGRYWTGLWILKYKLNKDISEFPFSTAQDFSNALDWLRSDKIPDNYWRHPLCVWNSEPGHDFSRDQTTPLVVAMSLWASTHPEMDFKARLQRLHGVHKARFWKYQNADIASPANINLYRRGIENKSTLMGDVFLFADVAIQCHKVKSNPDWTGDILNLTLAVMQAEFLCPTEMSNRAKNYLKANCDVQRCWDFYYRDESGNTVEFADKIWRPIISKWLK